MKSRIFLPTKKIFYAGIGLYGWLQYNAGNYSANALCPRPRERRHSHSDGQLDVEELLKSLLKSGGSKISSREADHIKELLLIKSGADEFKRARKDLMKNYSKDLVRDYRGYMDAQKSRTTKRWKEKQRNDNPQMSFLGGGAFGGTFKLKLNWGERGNTKTVAVKVRHN